MGMPMAKTGDPLRGAGGRMAYFVYIIKSPSFGSHYYGSAEHVETNLKRHNGSNDRYTKSLHDALPIYTEAFETRTEAYKRERFFKTVDGYKYLKEKGII